MLRVANAINREGGRSLIVGGGVRDALLGLHPKDFDLEVYGVEPDRLDSIVDSLEPTWKDVVGKSFGVLKVRFGEDDIDISIPRRESKSGSGHKGFQVIGDPTMTPEDAARRRDFTVNALAMDPFTDEVLDFFGGQKDLSRGILRATDPERFRDDPLRVLRTMQFAGRFGFTVEKGTLSICREMAQKPEFANLPAARIGEEWSKLLLKSPKPSVGLEIGLETGAFNVLHPELAALVDVRQDPKWHPEGDVFKHTSMVVDAAADIVKREGLKGDDALTVLLGALCHDFGKTATTQFIDGRWRSLGHESAGKAPTASFLSNMGFGKNIESRVAPLVANHLFPIHAAGDANDAAIRRLARRLQPATIKELVWVSEADHRGRGVPWDGFPAGAALLKRAEEMSISVSGPKPILMGRHLMDELHWEPGKYFGKVLKDIFEAQIDGRITKFDEALEMARSLGKSRV